MRTGLRIGWVALLTVVLCSLVAAQEATEPLDVDQKEEVEVRLVLIDVVAVDREGRTVPDLTIDDFELTTGGEVVPIDTLDIDCPAGRADDPSGVRHASRRGEPVAPDAGRKIVLAFDYLHLSHGERAESMEQAAAMIEHTAGKNDEVMLAALNGGLRVEQPFSSDRDEVLASLKEMEYDISLWGADYFHMNEFGFVDGMTALFDVVGTHSGPKAVVLFSAMEDVPLDLEFQQLAAVAAGARCSLYPVDVTGIRPPDLSGVGPRPG